MPFDETELEAVRRKKKIEKKNIKKGKSSPFCYVLHVLTVWGIGTEWHFGEEAASICIAHQSYCHYCVGKCKSATCPSFAWPFS
jgi:hypothetical protein